MTTDTSTDARTIVLPPTSAEVMRLAPAGGQPRKLRPIRRRSILPALRGDWSGPIVGWSHKGDCCPCQGLRPQMAETEDKAEPDEQTTHRGWLAIRPGDFTAALGMGLRYVAGFAVGWAVTLAALGGVA